MLKHVALVFLMAAAAASAATQRVPGSRVILNTSGFENINPSNASLQDVISWVDSNWVHQVTGSDVAMTTNEYDTVTGSNVQENIDSLDNLVTNIEARLSSAESTVALPPRMYSYEPTGTLSTATGGSGSTAVSVGAADVGRVHVGMAVSNDPVISVGTVITSVNFSARSVGISAALVTALETTMSFYATGSSASVTFDHVVPSGYGRCKIYVTGSGAGGGTNGASNCGGGGGAGGTAFGMYSLAAGDAYSVVVGRGGRGTGGTGSGVGSNGVTSSFGTLLSATGGQGGLASQGEGDGGVGVGGQINMPGEAGVSVLSTDTEPGHGGSSFWGGGGFGDSPSAKAPGAGGAGGDYDGSSTPAGAGMGGIVVIEYY
jgi:hypothetical protein